MAHVNGIAFFSVWILSAGFLVPAFNIAQGAPSCSITSSEQRFDCYPEVNATEQQCLDRGCCWDPIPNQNTSGAHRDEYPQSRYPIHVGAPPCYYPDGYPTYTYTGVIKTQTGYTAYLSRSVPSPFPNDISEIRMDVYFETDYRLRIKITDSNNARYEVPWPSMPSPDTAATNPLYDIAFDSAFGFLVSRKSTQEIIFGANIGSWIFSDQFIQLSAKLTNTNLYGIGQHNDNFKRSFDWQLIPLFASLLYPDYGSHPFYLMMENSYQSHGVFLFNSNALDVLLQPTPAISYRVTGGILDFYFFLGPTPNDVVQQYNELIGHPAMPPYWSLGFHFCKYDYGGTNETWENWNRNKNAGIPFDAQWNDIDYMTNFRDFTYDTNAYSNIKEMVDDFHNNGYHYVVITDAGISQVDDGSYPSYTDGVLLDVFVKNDSGGYATGQVWPEVSVFVDYTHPNAGTYWTAQFSRFHDDVPYDGAWIDMNEPTTFTSGSVSNTCTSNAYDNPPYTPDVEGGFLNSNTICMSSKHYSGIHYNLHNLFGFMDMNYTYSAMKSILGKRPFVLTRSSAPGSGPFGFHWTGDIYSSWGDLKQSIPSLLNFNLYGIPMVGSDICGFRENTTLELCQRWTQLGAFYPFARNHNDHYTIFQDPVSLGPEMVAVAKEALNLRYKFLPFFYSQNYQAHTTGENLIRPLFFEFPNDVNTYDIQEQFLWAQSLMVIPIINQGSSSESFYFPAGTWYLYPAGTKLTSSGQSFTLDQPLSGSGLQLALREGYIIPTQEPALTTTLSRNNNFGLLVTLNSDGEAEGNLFWDDGDTIDSIENGLYTYITFLASQNTLTSTIVNSYTLPAMVANEINIYNLPNEPRTVTVNGVDVTSFNYDNTNQILFIQLNLAIDQEFTIAWT